MTVHRPLTVAPSLFRLAGLAASVLAAFALTGEVAIAADPAPAGAAEQKQEAPKLSGLKASVAQGGSIELAASSFTSEELAALRPHYQDLKPKIRDNGPH